MKATSVLAMIACLFAADVYAQNSSDAIEAQNKLLQQQTEAEERHEYIRSVERFLQDFTIDRLFAVYEALKKAGVEILDPQDEIANLKRYSAVSVVASYDNGKFIVITGFLDGRRDPLFAVAGFGSVSALGYLRDGDFEDTGMLSSDCQYEIFIVNQRLKYRCAPLLARELDDAVQSDMQSAIISAISEKASYQQEQ